MRQFVDANRGNKYDEGMIKQRTKFKTDDIAELNGTIWKMKKDKGLSLKSEIKRAVIPDSFKAIAKEIEKTHNIQKLEFGKKVVVEV